jgi:ABC-type multidrug transport system fused ATPase/permease subunit
LPRGNRVEKSPAEARAAWNRSLFPLHHPPYLARSDPAAPRDGGELSAHLHQPRDPKRIVNNAIGGKNIPQTFLGFEVTQISYLMALSLLLLTLITVNGGIKYWLNVYRGVVGERTMRRMRHELYEKVLRFPLPQFKTMSGGEIIPMIVAETEPIGSFIGDSINLPVFQGGLLLTYLVFIFNQNSGSGSPRLRSTRRRST